MSHYNSSKSGKYHNMKGSGSPSSPKPTNAPDLKPATRGQNVGSGASSPSGKGGSGKESGPSMWD